MFSRLVLFCFRADPIHSPPKRGALGNHIFRCKRCRAHFLSHFNAHRCSAMHTTRRTTVSTSGTSHQASLPYLPDRAELLTFWAALQPVKAAAILDLRTPGETVPRPTITLAHTPLPLAHTYPA
jgi:hypothetical protein